MLTPNANANPLLDDIDGDYHQFLLEKGNLVRRPPAVSWSDENSWKSLGYSARVSRLVCACGAVHVSMLGIFHEESTPSGKRRSLALAPNAQIPLHQNFPVYVENVSGKICPSCLTSHGFNRSIA